jgi:nucleoside-diphosphate-sugar epimerase
MVNLAEKEMKRKMKRILVLGGGGFIGGHLVKRLTKQGHWVRSADLKDHLYGAQPNEFYKGDLRDPTFVKEVFNLENNLSYDEVYQLAADMGGAGYIFTGENDANVMHNSALINLNILKEMTSRKEGNPAFKTRIFYSSSACIYPAEIQSDTEISGLKESDAYPANPDSEYGWEKLFSERLYLAYCRNFDLEVRIARFHNVFGPEGTWTGGKEKAPAAICRKVASAKNADSIEVWGDGSQTRSFLYVSEALDAVQKLMNSPITGPINIGSEEKVSIKQLVELVADIANKKISIRQTPGPLGVRGRNSNNDLVREKLGWNYSMPLREGLALTYDWIVHQLNHPSYHESH